VIKSDIEYDNITMILDTIQLILIDMCL